MEADGKPAPRPNDDGEPERDHDSEQAIPNGEKPTGSTRALALLEIVACSGFPTQFALAGTLAAFGYLELTVDYVVILSLADTVLVIGLILLILNSHREHPRAMFLATRPVRDEIRAGIPLIFAALGLALVVMAAVRALAPWLQPDGPNPLEDLIRTPRAAALFSIVVVVAGGLREELQRAFVLRRFDRGLGGPRVGVVVGSLMFGAGHLLQGADAALATAALGAFWAVIYLRRRSIVAPVVSHAGFNLLQLAQLVIAMSQAG